MPNIQHKLISIPTYGTVVIGAGVIGLSTAWNAMQNGETVCVLEQHDKGHALGGTVGETRLVRHQEVPFTEELKNETVLKLSSLSIHEETLLIKDPAVLMGHVTSGVFKERDSSRVQGLEPLDSHALNTLSPYLRLTPDHVAFKDPKGGVLQLANLMTALEESLSETSETIQYKTGLARYSKDEDGLFDIETTKGDHIRAKHLVLAKGPWAVEESNSFSKAAGKKNPYCVQKLDLFFYQVQDAETKQPMKLPPMLMRVVVTQAEVQGLLDKHNDIEIPHNISAQLSQNGELEVPMYAMTEGDHFKVGYRIVGCRELIDHPTQANRTMHDFRLALVTHILETKVLQQVSLTFNRHTTGLITVPVDGLKRDETPPVIAGLVDDIGAIHFLADSGICAKLSLAIGRLLFEASKTKVLPQEMDFKAYLNR